MKIVRILKDTAHLKAGQEFTFEDNDNRLWYHVAVNFQQLVDMKCAEIVFDNDAQIKEQRIKEGKDSLENFRRKALDADYSQI